LDFSIEDAKIKVSIGGIIMDVDISLSGSGLEFTRKITLFQATQIMAFIAKPTGTEMSEQRAELLDEVIAPEPKKIDEVNTSNHESPHQAIDQLHAKTNSQKIVAISLFLGASGQNGKVLQNDEVLTEFARAGEATPTYFNRDLKDAVSAGYIYAVDKKSFRLLSPADSVEEMGFKKSKRKRTANKMADGEKLPKPTIRAEVNSLSLTTGLDGHIDYFDTPARADQILWILQYAKIKGMADLNRLEICQISAKLGGDINSRTYASSNVANVKNGYIASAGQAISMTVKGERHLTELSTQKKD